MKKRILGLMIFIVLICCLGPVYASENVTLTSSSDTVKSEETFTLTVSASNSAGLNGIDATVDYDEDVLEFVEANLVDTTNWSEYDSFPELTAMWKTSGSDTTSADIYEITFKVKSITSNTTTSIKLKDITLSLNSADDIQVDDITKTITLQTTSSSSPSASASASASASPSASASASASASTSPSSSSNSSSSSSTSSSSSGSSSSQVSSSSGSASSTSSVSANAITTTSEEDIPETGKSTLLKILIPFMIIMTFVFYKRYKKYDDI